MPIIDFFPISLDTAFDLLEQLNQVSTTVEIFQVIEFSNDIDAVHYKLRWGDAEHVLENIWTFPIKGGDPKGWLVENARDSLLLEWVEVYFMTSKAQSRFTAALMAASTLALPQP